MQSLEYSERLVSLKLYSLQRRRERCCIIYVWKIIEGLVPNFSKPIVCSYSERRGRSCIISHVNLGRLGSLAYNSFRWRAICLFNAMPKYISCISSCSVVSFKSKLDCYLNNNNNNNNNNNCLKSNIQCIEIRVQWTVHLGSSHMHVHAVTPKLVICVMYLTSI